MKKGLSFIIALIILFINVIPASAQEIPFTLESEAVILIEEETGKVLYEKNAYKRVYPASTTKILTALMQ